jgi:hypothetical protein
MIDGIVTANAGAERVCDIVGEWGQFLDEVLLFGGETIVHAVMLSDVGAGG